MSFHFGQLDLTKKEERNIEVIQDKNVLFKTIPFEEEKVEESI